METLNPGYNFEEAYFEPLDFDRQFSLVHALEQTGDAIEYVDLKPEAWQDRPALVVIGGWHESLGSLRGLGEALFHESDSRRTLITGLSPAVEEIPSDDIQRKIADKTATLIEFLKAAEIGQADILLQSEGVLSGLLAASQQPELFNNIIIATPSRRPAGNTLRWVKLLLLGAEITRPEHEQAMKGCRVELPFNWSNLPDDGQKNPGDYLKAVNRLSNQIVNQSLKGGESAVGILRVYTGTPGPRYQMKNRVKIKRPEKRLSAYTEIFAQADGRGCLEASPQQVAPAILELLNKLNKGDLAEPKRNKVKHFRRFATPRSDRIEE